jgi:hypothetical protein
VADRIPRRSTVTSIFVVSIVSLVSWAFTNAVLTSLGARVYLGDAPDVADAVRKAIPHIGTLIGVAIVRALLYFIGLLMVLVGVAVLLLHDVRVRSLRWCSRTRGWAPGSIVRAS